MSFRSRFVSALAGAVLAVSGLFGTAPVASAATINFTQYWSGEDVGTGPLASLEATQVGSAVRFVLTNLNTAHPRSFISQLFLTYTGNLAALTSFTQQSGVNASNALKGSFTNAALTFQILIEWPTSGNNNGALRLKPGQSSTFDLANADLSGFFSDENSAMIHVQGLNSGGSTKYLGGTEPSPVPLPAAGWLMIAGLGGLAALRRKARAV